MNTASKDFGTDAIEVGNRIKQRMDALGLKQVDLVDKDVAKKATISNWISGVNKPTGDRLIELSKVLVCSPEYILTGDGWVGDPSSPRQQGDDVIYVDVLDVTASCGLGSFNDIELVKDRIPFKKSWLRKRGIHTNANQLKMVYGVGNSMAPTITDSSLVLLDLHDNDPKTLANDGVYAFIAGGALRIKRISIDLLGNIRFSSDNPNKERYPDESISKDQSIDLKIVGRVRWNVTEI